jgi:hypothetical protein
LPENARFMRLALTKSHDVNSKQELCKSDCGSCHSGLTGAYAQPQNIRVWACPLSPAAQQLALEELGNARFKWHKILKD